jgi:hypothetical protein
MKHLTVDLHRCPSCELISSAIGPDLSMYDKSYLTKYARYDRTKQNEAIKALRLGAVKQSVNGAGKDGIRSLLDFGCATGSFLDAVKLFCPDCEARGYDPNPYGEHTDLSVLFGHYDVVTMWDVVEHLPNPVPVLRNLNTMAVCLCTPNTDDFHLGLEHLPEWRHYYPGEHVHYYNKTSLAALLECCGYKVSYTSYKESKVRDSGGSGNIITMGGVRHG